MNYGGYPEYVSVAKKKAKAAKQLKQLKKKMPDITPVVIEGKSLARTWWGKSWNKNLERYADYSNRIGRGRSYVRHGAVLDLKIAPGKVTALVQGSTSKPYKVVVNIKAISQANWLTIKKQCKGKLTSLQDLLSGKFPKNLGETFFADGKGLFPRPEAIQFDCSCPDWASMCKHVAAVLYGIGARFDEDPSLFFTLSGAKMSDLIAQAIKEKTSTLLAKTKKKSSKVIQDTDLGDMFGIDMGSKPDFSGSKKITKPMVSHRRGRAKSEKSGGLELREKAIDLVAQVIMVDNTGVTMEKLHKKTGFSRQKLYGLVHRLKQKGEIKNKSRGVYVNA